MKDAKPKMTWAVQSLDHIIWPQSKSIEPFLPRWPKPGHLEALLFISFPDIFKIVQTHVKGLLNPFMETNISQGRESRYAQREVSGNSPWTSSAIWPWAPANDLLQSPSHLPLLRCFRHDMYMACWIVTWAPCDLSPHFQYSVTYFIWNVFLYYLLDKFLFPYQG